MLFVVQKNPEGNLHGCEDLSTGELLGWFLLGFDCNVTWN